ncbi:HAD family hydrolase [Lyngbya sp. PCC 8106]|uniref:HAD-IA family hydrolase n=1 Tax=Lyngbya sp. (strain PCC 8106) TaxID=313612 RepID=UPI0000EABD17|nr:HAD family hydrolase [Lyngbya sp. PCC 8106]EAW33395.1 HAD-superfamily hydrolase, subfamily IA, variant 1 [Lyngbya sp. PCC 8106]
MIFDTFKPQVIFLDAVGTLFGVRDSVGAVYAKLANQFGVIAEPNSLNQAFFQKFATSPIMAFPEKSLEEIPQLEFEWWELIAINTFKQVGLFKEFEDFSEFFKVLYAYFETDEPWFVYPDVQPMLKQWQNQGIELGVLSNFDSRLYPVLEALNLAEYFNSVTISTHVGAAKPDPKIFTIALQKHQCSPEKVVHIGDSFKADYQGAKAAGIRGILIDRNEQEKSDLIKCTSLKELQF